MSQTTNRGGHAPFTQRNGQHRAHPPASFTPELIQQALQNPNLRFADYPGLVQIGYQLIAEPNDPELQEIFATAYTQLVSAAQLSENPFRGNEPPLTTSLCDAGDIVLLALWNGAGVGMSAVHSTSNIALVGPTGKGKSTAKRGIIQQLGQRDCTVICLDRKREDRQLLADPLLGGRVCVLSVEDLKLSLYQPMAGVPTPVIQGGTTELIARSTGRMYAQRQLLELVPQILAMGDPQHGLGLLSLQEHLRQLPVHGFRQADNKESMLLALQHVQAHLGGIFDYRQSSFMERLFAQPGVVIIELPTLPPDLYGLLASYLMYWIYLQRLYNPATVTRPVLFVLDDATAAIDRQMDRDAVGGTPPIVEHAFMGRGLQIGLIVCAHVARDMSSKLLANCRTILCMGATGEDVQFLKSHMGLTQPQADKLRELPPGQAVAFVPAKWPKALWGFFPPSVPQVVSDSQCRDSARQFLAQVSCVPATPIMALSGPGPQARGPTQALTVSTVSPTTARTQGASQLKAMLLLAEALPPTITDIYTRVGLSRAEGKRLFTMLETQGFIRLHRFATGQRGGALTIGEVLEKGWDFLTQHGCNQRPACLTHGGFEHNLPAHALQRLAKRAGSQIEFEVDLGPVRADALWRSPQGVPVYYQIGVSDEAREADGLARALQVPAVGQNTIVLVSRDRRFAERVTKLLQQRLNARTLPTQIRFRTIGELLHAALRAGNTPNGN